jgi:hypothetical protein
VKNGTKTSYFGAPVPTEVPCFHNYLAGAQKTAKPLCVGSIPTRASKFFPINNEFSDLRRFSQGFFCISFSEVCTLRKVMVLR